jgi:hypothetical protein
MWRSYEVAGRDLLEIETGHLPNTGGFAVSIRYFTQNIYTMPGAIFILDGSVQYFYCNLAVFEGWKYDSEHSQTEQAASVLRSLINRMTHTIRSHFLLAVVSGRLRLGMLGLLTCMYHVSCSHWNSRASLASGRIVERSLADMLFYKIKRDHHRVPRLTPGCERLRVL